MPSRTFFGKKKQKKEQVAKEGGEVDVDSSGFAVGGMFSTLAKKAASLETSVIDKATTLAAEKVEQLEAAQKRAKTYTTDVANTKIGQLKAIETAATSMAADTVGRLESLSEGQKLQQRMLVRPFYIIDG